MNTYLLRGTRSRWSTPARAWRRPRRAWRPASPRSGSPSRTSSCSSSPTSTTTTSASPPSWRAAPAPRSRARRSSPRYLADLDASMEADDDYAVALMRRHGVTPGDDRDARRGQPRLPPLRRGGASRSAASSSPAASSRRAGAAGRSPSGPATRRRTPCSPRTGSCSPATTCWRRSPPTRSRTCPSACPTPSPSRRRPDRPRTLLTYLALARGDRGRRPRRAHPARPRRPVHRRRRAGREARGMSERRAQKILAGARRAAHRRRGRPRPVAPRPGHAGLPRALRGARPPRPAGGARPGRADGRRRRRGALGAALTARAPARSDPARHGVCPRTARARSVG